MQVERGGDLNYIFAFRGFNTEVAMRKAKENVEKHYAVVGVLEELNKTLTVLEHYVPRFFKGAKDVYYSEYSSIQHSMLLYNKEAADYNHCFPDEVQVFSKINRNIYKPPVAEVGSQANKTLKNYCK